MNAYSNERKRLINERRLWMLLDLDLTIVHSVYVNEELPEKYKQNNKVDSINDAYVFKPNGTTGYYIIKFRPGLRDFILFANKYYEICIYTAGTRDYALYIIKMLKKYILHGINPNEKYDIFGSRIITRNETRSMIIFILIFNTFLYMFFL